jgi:hypothetical protein
LEKSAQTVTKGRSIRVVRKYGLYHDPITARLLLGTHLALVRKGITTERGFAPYAPVLRDLNWMVRREALYASLQGTMRGAKLFGHEVKPRGVPGGGGRAGKGGDRGHRGKKAGRGKRGSGSSSSSSSAYEYILGGKLVPASNPLARLRLQCGDGALRIVFGFL